MILAILGVILILVIIMVFFFAFGLVASAIAAVVMGIVMTVIKIFIVPRFEARDRFRLETDNVRLRPEKLEVRFDNLKNGYVIDCFYTSPETGKKFVFSTEPFAKDPTPFLTDAKLTVVANRVDYSNYYVDLVELKDRL